MAEKFERTMIKSENYVTIQGWMLDLDIKGNELLVYAVIYGFSQAEGTCYSGSVKYLMEWTKSSENGVLNALKALVEKGYLEKRSEGRGSAKKNYYRAIYGEELNESNEPTNNTKENAKAEYGANKNKYEVVKAKYRQYINKKITPMEIAEIESYTDSVGADVVWCAVDECVMCKNTSPKYLFAILKRCREEGIKTKEAFYKSLEKHKKGEKGNVFKTNAFNGYDGQRDYDDDELEEIVRRKSKKFGS